MSIAIRPVEADDVPALGALLERRHADHRAAEPLLAGAPCEETLRSLLDRDAVCRPVVALDAGRPVAYLAGEVRDNWYWHAHAWVDHAGHAFADAEALRDLYAAAAPAWIEAGARLHLAMVPATPQAMDPWERLGFARMQVFGVRPAGGDAASPPDGVAIRLARHDDLAAVAATQGRLIWDEQTAAPTFTGLTPPDWDTVLADWVETFSDDRDTVFIAERAGAIVGHTLLHAPPDAGLGWPAGAIQLATAAVVPGERGGGVGTALVTRALHWAAEQGHEVVIVDWRIANLRASRFWPERGFRPAYHRMSRMTGIG